MLNNNEIWVVLPNYSNYEISNKGNIKSKRQNKIMRSWRINSGYSVISLVDNNGKSTKWLVHRLVATAFIKNTLAKPLINHIDGNKLNNNATNLEWCSNSENITHARATGLNVYNYPTAGKKLSGKKHSISNYYGVSYDNARKKWIGLLCTNGRIYKQRRFTTENAAAEHYNNLVKELKLNRPLNVIV